MWIYQIDFLFWGGCFVLLEWLLLVYYRSHRFICELLPPLPHLPSCMVVVWLIKWAQYKCHPTQDWVSELEERGELGWFKLLSAVERKKNVSIYCGCIYCFVMLYVPLELLVFFMGSFDGVNKADRLGESYLAFMSFVSSHFCCSLVPGYLGVYSVLYCS